MRHRQRAAAAAFFLLALTALAGCDKFKSKQAIKKGNEFLKAAQYQSALAEYEEALRLDPGETKLHKHLGIAYMGMYQPGSKHPKDLEYAQKAIDNLKLYVQAYPDDNKALEYLVSMYLNTERYDDAIAFYQNEFLKRNPKDAKAMNSLAMLYFKKGDFDNGVLWLKKRLELEGTNPEVYYLIGVQAWDRSYNFPDLDPALRAKIVDEGLQSLNKAVELKPDYFEAVSYINLLYREKAKMETDPAKKQEYTDTANKYLQQALEMRKAAQEKAKAAQPTPEPAK
ncbi:MAG TPA: tetratricopeptide repeat protein [Thermoanaerobaculia bacterium]|nr:tetratricopeptide repeat protein [Thermoanaerobaculia bacterium]